MKIDCQYDKVEQRWEYAICFTKDGKIKSSYVYENPKRSEVERRQDLVNWLNKCFQEYDKETPSQ
jgi:hypothetical protein